MIDEIPGGQIFGVGLMGKAKAIRSQGAEQTSVQGLADSVFAEMCDFSCGSFVSQEFFDPNIPVRHGNTARRRPYGSTTGHHAYGCKTTRHSKSQAEREAEGVLVAAPLVAPLVTKNPSSFAV